MRIAMVSEHASPLQAMLGGVDAGGQNVFVADLTRALARRGVEVTVYTRRDELAELVRLGADRHRVSVIPCGVDLETFRPDGPAAPRLPGFHRVVVVSRLVERKGIGNAISALAEVPRCELVIAGGPSASHLN